MGRNIEKEGQTILGTLRELRETVGSLEEACGQLQKENLSLANVVVAIRDVVGADQVDAAVRAAKLAEKKREAAAQRALLEKGVEDGYVIPAAEVGDKRVVVIEETANGEPVGAGRIQYPFESFTDEYKERLIGKKVGDKIENPNGSTFEVVGVYEIDVDKYRRHQDSLSKKAADARTEAEAEASRQLTAAATGHAPDAPGVSDDVFEAGGGPK